MFFNDEDPMQTPVAGGTDESTEETPVEETETPTVTE